MIEIFDSTLRDGAQSKGISFSVDDKIKIVRILDEIGVKFIEAGNPGSNPKDLEFFERIKLSKLNNSILTAFGSTRRRNVSVEKDSNLNSLLSAGTSAITIFGKSWDFHVTDIINASLDENLQMIADTISFLKRNDKYVLFDAEHFFDGYKNNKNYAIACLKTAIEAGADCLVLCDTNGIAFPLEVFDITKTIVDLGVPVGIHCHNDCAMAVANSMMAVSAGACHVQGTFIGFGERCGNANLSTIIANLQLKQNIKCIPDENMQNLTAVARFIADVSNIHLSSDMPYVGKRAFTHKAGMHIDAITKSPFSFEHVDPAAVGNERRLLTSEVAGRSTIISKIQKVNPNITKSSPETDRIIKRLKDLEHQGYQFESAESTFELIIRKELGKYKPFFELEHFKVIAENGNHLDIAGQSASAIIKVIVEGKAEITAAEGDGPVNALDKALRKALEVFYPSLSSVHLTDYKVRVMESNSATASKVRVLIESSDGFDSWSTVGVSTDIIEASWIALVDSIEYKLIKDIELKFKTYL